MDTHISFPSNNLTLVGNLHVPRKGAPAVVFCHGLASSMGSEKWLALAYRFYDEGFSVLRFNFRGCGVGEDVSEGDPLDSSLTSRIKDYYAALDFLQKSGKVDTSRIAVIGSSLGSCTAVAGNDPRMKAYVLLATPPKMFPSPEMLRSFHEKGFFELDAGEGKLFRITQSIFDDYQKYDMFALVKRVKRPLLMVQGSKDEIPINWVQRLFETANEPKRFEIIEGGSHTFSDNPAHLAQVIDLSVEWLKRWLIEIPCL